MRTFKDCYNKQYALAILYLTALKHIHLHTSPHAIAYMLHISGHIVPDSAYFPAYFASKLPAYFKKNSAINQRT